MHPSDFYKKADIDKREYDKIHAWLRYNYGKPPKCFMCGKLGHKNKRWNIQYALLKGKPYKKIIENFIPLCASCHEKYDDINAGRICELKGCIRDYWANGMCKLHYYRKRYREKYSGHPQKWSVL